MALYLDVEFNGHANGELISLALASTCGHHFYEVGPEPRVWTEWCGANVLPVLDKEAVSREYLRKALQVYLQHRPGVKIYADYPGDFEHLMRLMCGDSYEEHWIASCKMVLLSQSDPKPKTPHNALSDAIALMDWHLREDNE